MSTAKKFCYGIILLLLCAALTATAVFSRRASYADETAEAATLVPIATDNDAIAYKCFDAPNSVFADGAGLAVAGDRSVEFISGETEVTSVRDIPSDKVYRHLERGEHGEYIIVLRDGRLSLYFGDEPPAPLLCGGAEVGGIVDFAVGGDKLYAVGGDTLFSVALGANGFDGEATATGLYSAQHGTIDVHGVAVLDGKVYAAINSAFGKRDDICLVSGNELTVALRQADTVMSMSAAAGSLYVLTRSEVTSYRPVDGGIGLVETHSAPGATYTDIYAYGGYVYALDSLNALHKLSGDLSAAVTLFASGSDIKGYFNTPSGIAVKNSRMYVADTLNNRIAIYGKTIEYADREFITPVSVACDSAGTVYVAYEYNKIGIFEGGDFSPAVERVVTGAELGYIKQIVVNADKTLFALTSTGLWTVKHGETAATRISDKHYKAVALGFGRDKLYALDDDGIYDLGGDAPKIKCAAKSDVISFAVDIDGSVFMLTANSIRTYRVLVGTPTVQEYSLRCDGEKYTLGGKIGQLVLCSVNNNYVGHGDILVVDGNKHRILKTNGTAIGVRLVDGNYIVPDLVGNKVAEYYGPGLIRTALRNTEVYALPAEGASVYTISRGRNVIVPQYALEDAKEYALVLIDDTENGKLVQGYVYKDALSQPLEYSAPPASACTVFNAATPVYKFPSRHSQALYNYAAVDSNTEFGMLDFVAEYRDDYGNLWYRIALDGGTEGFILSVNVSIGNYEPVFIRPAANAEIISYKGSTSAPGYILENGVYTQITELPTGTRVEVVGAFDSSEQYTEVKYFDADRGTLTCYVKTVYLKYNGVNIVLLVAIIVIIITVTLAAIIVARVLHNKKKNLLDDKDDEENEKL